MTDFHTLELTVDARGVAQLWLNRPDKNNAFDARTIEELIQALGQVAQDDRVRLLVLRGRGRHFCGGADLAWMQASAELDYQGNLADAQRLGELLHALHRLPKPTLAIVQGAAFGGGLGLVACCDLALAAHEAQFCLSEVRIGLIPATIGPFVSKAIGQRAATRYALTAERFDGQRARELGLVDEACPIAELEAQAEAWIANLLNNSPAALVACKALFQEIGAGELSADLRGYTEAAIARIRISPEGQEGLRAFLEKRTPAWRENT
ncbi:MAG: 1,4-dihydroxy-2-naphthoyl-CoA synthase [Pseudomonas citronellolis]|nr:MAG: 1,4-dihydroxy-2-naphthoyl-CoA synthase [Pseudomonas citronellolis]